MSRWLDRALLAGPHYCLCLTDRAFQKELDMLNVAQNKRPNFIKTDIANATTHFLEYRGKTAAIITMDRKDHTGIQVAALLCHEAVHIWQDFRRGIGETHPGDETEAYAIQTITQRLMESFADQTRRK